MALVAFGGTVCCPVRRGYNGLSGLINPIGDARDSTFQSHQYFFLGFCVFEHAPMLHLYSF